MITNTGRPTLVLGLTMLAVAGMVTTAYAQEYETIKVDIHAKVTDVHIEHGLFADWWYITVEVTNNNSDDIWVGISHVWLEDNYGWLTLGESDPESVCYWEETTPILDAGSKTTILGCLPAAKDKTQADVVALAFSGRVWSGYEWSDAPFAHVLPVKPNGCDLKGDWQTCQSTQNIDRLIREAQREADSDPEPMTCEVPTTTTTTTEPDTDQPQLVSAAYHTIFADLVLAFDEDVTLADGWQDSITVGGISIGERARNHVDGASGIAWISVEYSAGLNIRDVAPHTVIIEPGTFIDADGNTNDRIRVTPTITG